MARLRRLKEKVFSLALLAVAAGATLLLQFHNEASVSGNARIIDGDTLVVSGERLRLLGIDAPEWDQTCGSQNWPCGKQATQHLRARVRGKTVTCTTFGRDKYHRLLATCHISAASGRIDIAGDLVANGYAIATQDYFASEKAARAANKNIWSGPFDRPAQWRQGKRDKSENEDGFWTRLFSRFQR